MLERLVIFGIGYLLGAQAGKKGLNELTETVRGLLDRDEVKMAVALAGGVIEDRFSSRSEGLRVA
jgi:hypothetical protein